MKTEREIFQMSVTIYEAALFSIAPFWYHWIENAHARIFTRQWNKRLYIVAFAEICAVDAVCYCKSITERAHTGLHV